MGTTRLRRGSGKILVVDDEVLLRTLICDGLAAAGHTVVPTSSGEEALKAAKAERPECILLDIMMPGLDGYDTCAALKADSETASIPVILISATTDVRVIERAENVGAAAVLPKPVPMEQLEHTVDLALNPPA